MLTDKTQLIERMARVFFSKCSYEMYDPDSHTFSFHANSAGYQKFDQLCQSIAIAESAGWRITQYGNFLAVKKKLFECDVVLAQLHGISELDDQLSILCVLDGCEKGKGVVIKTPYRFRLVCQLMGDKGFLNSIDHLVKNRVIPSFSKL